MNKLFENKTKKKPNKSSHVKLLLLIEKRGSTDDKYQIPNGKCWQMYK